jgi:hypothetical protein
LTKPYRFDSQLSNLFHTYLLPFSFFSIGALRLKQEPFASGDGLGDKVGRLLTKLAREPDDGFKGHYGTLSAEAIVALSTLTWLSTLT